MKTPAKTVCYSYIRFSTTEQQKGDSARRQLEATKQFINKNKHKGFILDESLSFQDLGVSAFDRSNIEKGALGKFLQLVDDGRIKPGSILIVEALDRISRDNAVDFQILFLEIIKKGIKILTLMDEKLYSYESIRENPIDLMLSLVYMIRGNEESATKSKRLKAAWKNKRSKAKAGKIITRNHPSWMYIVNGDFVLIPEKVNIVKQIFELSLNGWGYEKIAIHMNQQKVKPFRSKTGWSKQAVKSIIGSRAVLGELVPSKKIDGKYVNQDPIPKYYPQIIDHKTFQKIQERIASFYTGGGGQNGKIRNLFGRINKCGLCGGSMKLLTKDKKYRYLVCDRAKNGNGCIYKTIRVDLIEHAFFKFAYEMDVSSIINTDTEKKQRSKVKALEKKKDDIESQLIQLDNEYNNIKKFVASGKASAEIYEDLSNDMDNKFERKKELNKTLLKIENDIAVIERSTEETTYKIDTLKKLYYQLFISNKNQIEDEETIKLRYKTRALIRELVKRIDIFPVGQHYDDRTKKMYMEHGIKIEFGKDIKVSKKEKAEINKNPFEFVEQFERYATLRIHYKTGNIVTRFIDKEKPINPSEILPVIHDFGKVEGGKLSFVIGDDE